MQLTTKDLAQLGEKGITQEKIVTQVKTFKEGIPFVKLKSSATIGKGIVFFTAKEEQDLLIDFERKKNSLSLLKFVPASGAATRMFKALYAFLKEFNPENESFNAYIERTDDVFTKTFFERVTEFPFYKEIKEKLEKNIAFIDFSKDKRKYAFVEEMIGEQYTNFGFLPKGLLPFHRYEQGCRTPFEEHLYEAAQYSVSNNKAKIHFTISKIHKPYFEALFSKIESDVSAKTGVDYEVSYSYQKIMTDTVAVRPNNELFREKSGDLLFRPSGHGALIENLNELDADIIFIKNIDNIVAEQYLEKIAESKKILAAKLVKLQAKAFVYAKVLDSNSNAIDLDAIKLFLTEELNVSFLSDFNTLTTAQKREVLATKLNRPIRICGMVKNQGAPGGGPFWVEDANGVINLQIIETAQIDKESKTQLDILSNATHFNPVDLVCGVRNYKGEKYNLLDFVDSSQGFISNKTKDGKALKALELPGLWNGAMAKWNTVFVAVPLFTFNPVKTVNDLLTDSHIVVCDNEIKS